MAAINVAPTIQTVVVIVVFSVVYLLFVVRRTLSGQLDLYDLIMLSTVSIVPLLFVAWPDFADLVAHATGVAFPFVTMFAALFLVVFIFMHRMTSRLHKLERENCTLLQEVSLLSHELEQAEGVWKKP